MTSRHTAAQQGFDEIDLGGNDIGGLLTAPNHCLQGIILALFHGFAGKAGLDPQQALGFFIAKGGFALDDSGRNSNLNRPVSPLDIQSHFLTARDHDRGLKIDEVIDFATINRGNLVACPYPSGGSGPIGQHV